MITAKDVQDVIDLFGENGERWCQNHYAVDEDGNAIDTDTPAAVKFCLVGSGFHLFPERRSEWQNFLDDSFSDNPLHTGPVSFNDRYGRTFPEVKAELEHLKEIAEK